VLRESAGTWGAAADSTAASDDGEDGDTDSDDGGLVVAGIGAVVGAACDGSTKTTSLLRSRVMCGSFTLSFEDFLCFLCFLDPSAGGVLSAVGGVSAASTAGGDALPPAVVSEIVKCEFVRRWRAFGRCTEASERLGGAWIALSSLNVITVKSLCGADDVRDTRWRGKKSGNVSVVCGCG